MDPIKIYTSSTENVFLNSKCLFVEYNDIIKMPQFFILLAIRENEMMNKMFDLSDIQGYPTSALFEWYIERKHQNILMNFPIRVKSNSGKTREQICHEVLNDLLNLTEDFYSSEGSLSFASVIRTIMKEKHLVQKIVIYSSYENKFIRSDIVRNYEDNVTYSFGKFEDVIADIPHDSTFVFSDINKVNRLIEMKRINFSSILLPINYRYNMDENDRSKFKINFETLASSFTFKYNFFNNFA